MPNKKVGIITISNGPANYGNLLQNYALQQILSSFGLKTFSIQDIRYNSPLRLILKPAVHYITRIRYRPEYKKTVLCFLWKIKHIRIFPKLIRSLSDGEKIDKYFNTFVVGSDQIWNPYWHADELSFLRFTSQEKRIAYAPSFGVSHIPESKINEISPYLSSFFALSIREISGANIIKEITGLEVPVLLDPTMLLSTKEWDTVIKKRKYPQSYVLVYVLGELTSEYNTFISTYTKKNKLLIINLKHYICDPGEFVGLIKNSNHIFTDSFHGCIFSLLYHKDFTILKRQDSGHDMLNRLDELITKFNLKVSYNCSIMQVSVNWESFESRLQSERNKSVEFFKSHLL